MSESATQPRAAKPRRRLRKLAASVGVLLLLLVAAAAGVWFFYLTDERVARLAEGALDDMVGCRTTIGSGQLDLSGRLVLSDVALDAEGMPGEGGRVFHADQIEIQLDRSALWRGAIEPTAITVHQPVLTLAEEVETGRLNVELLRPTAEGDGELPPLPTVVVDGGRFEFGQVEDGRFQLRGAVELAGSLTPNEGQTLELRLSEMLAGQPLRDGIEVGGEIDQSAGHATFALRGLSFSGRYRELLPRRVHEFWQQYEPTGLVPEVSFNIQSDGSWQSVVKLDGVALTMPRLTEDDYRFRMTDVAGRFVFTSDRVQIEDLTGTVEELQYRINGTLSGYDPDVPFDLFLSTDQFAIDPNAERRYVRALPKAVQEVFALFSPQGSGDLSMRLFRDNKDGPISYRGSAKIFDGQGQFERFPYLITELSGLVRFNGVHTIGKGEPTEGEIRISKLTGTTSGGGSATITGIITPPSEHPAVDLTITAIDLPLDEKLYQAFEERDRPAFDIFFHDEQYQRLLEAGHFITVDRYNELELEATRLRREQARLDEQFDADAWQQIERELAAIDRQLAVPVFALGGRANVVVHVVRDEGNRPQDRSRAFTDVDIKEASIVFKHFPYPLRVQRGRLRIEPGLITFDDIEATGLQGGSGFLTGSVKLPRKHDVDRKVRPDLQVRAEQLPLDAMLFDALPQPQDQVVRKLHPEGSIDVDGRIFATDAGEPQIDLLIELAGAKAQPGPTAEQAGDYPLTNVDGQLRVTLDELKITELTAAHGDGGIKVTGTAQWGDREAARVDVQVAAEDLRFQDPVLDLLRPFAEADAEWATRWQQQQLKGTFDAALGYQRRGDQPGTMSLALRPTTLNATIADRQWLLKQAVGTIHVLPEGLKLDAFGGRFDNAELTVSGKVQLTPAFAADLTLSAAGTAIDDDLKSVLPAGVVAGIDALQLQGGFEADLTELKITPRPEAETSDASLAGRIKLIDARGKLGAEITDFNGTLDLAAVREADRPGADLGLTLNAASLSFADRPLRALTAKAARPGDSDQIAFTDIKAEIYGGAIGGKAVVDPSQQAYSLLILATDLDVAQMTPKPDDDAQPKQGDDPPPLNGKLAASMNIEGRWGEKPAMKGKGTVKIRDGEMYELPLSMGLLQMAHLAMPLSRSFQAADIEYLLDNDKLTFEKIELDSPNMRMTGKGTADLDTKQVDLTFTSSNPDGLDLGPLTDIIDVARDQLVTIRVTGEIGEPQIKVRQFNAITQAWEDIFGGDRQQ